MRVAIAVTDAAAIKKNHVIEQRPVAVRGRPQPVNEPGEQADVMG